MYALETLEVCFGELLSQKSKLHGLVEELENLSRTSIELHLDELTGMWKEKSAMLFLSKEVRINSDISMDVEYLKGVMAKIDSSTEEIIRIENLNKAMGIIRKYN